MRKQLLAALMAAVVATPACAGEITKSSEGYTYFYRSGAVLAEHDADLRACRKQAGAFSQPQAQTPVMVGGGLAGAIGAAIAMAIIQAQMNAAARPVNVENCMVVKGWQVVALDTEEGKTLDQLDQAAKQAQVNQWVGAPQPHGVVVRTFANEPMSVATAGLFGPSSNRAKAMISADAAGKEAPADPKAKAPKEPKPQLPRMAKSARPPKPLKPENMGSIPEGMGLVVVNMRGAGSLNLAFERIGANPDTPAWIDGHPASFSAAQSPKAVASLDGSEGLTTVYALPAGRWRVAAMSAGIYSVSLCMGAPAFDLAAGEVLYAGAFDAASETGLGPNLDVEQVKAALPAASGLADRIRPAVYVNGTTGRCGGAVGYAMEIPGAPFVDGYAMGSKAPGQMAAPAAPPAEAAPAPAIAASAASAS